jgi:predicted nucleotidyltransferase
MSYVKYAPDPLGTWKKGRNRFERLIRNYTISGLLETFSFLKQTYPHYFFYSEPYNITMTAVPMGHVAEHFMPERKLTELLEKSRLDRLQKKLSRLVSLLSRLGNVEIDSFGVTGSLLLDIHNPKFSDLDLIIYGMENSLALKNALKDTSLAAGSGIRPFGKERLARWCLGKTIGHPLTLSEARRIFDRKWNIGLFDDTRFSIHPVKLEDELREKYGDKTYSPVGMVRMRLTVTDSSDSIYLPAVYWVMNAEGEAGVEVEEVASYDGLFGSVAENGETIDVRGKLEHVVDHRTGKTYYRILVGSTEGMGRDYIKPLV